MLVYIMYDEMTSDQIACSSVFVPGAQFWDVIEATGQGQAAILDVPADSATGPEPKSESEPQEKLTFFRVLDFAKAFNQLTLVGDTSQMLASDFLAATFVAVSIEHTRDGPKTATIVPSGAVLSATQLHAD